ncbi:6-phosphogluconolactonase [Mangrovitalea sediminis]|uniref:6-phosphogluconolactonase n=1 Tax=Mangrovitalea sediminis TaxID=1982043 RepID=UPI000BE580D1|nr:6-phosphogluconolactonase [Mangrovitalea sediminis]
MKMHELPWPDGVNLVEAGDRQALAQKLAMQVADWLSEALRHSERASLAVSGGRTPVPFFEALSGFELPWSRVDVMLVDERWVPPTDADSNERLVREHLLRGAAAKARFVGMKNAAATAAEGVSLCESALKSLHWPLDVVVLGMGNDGHTASLFPEAGGLAAAMAPGGPDLCAAIHPPAAPHERMTLTLAVLAEARHVALYVVGDDKAVTLGEALAAPERLFDMPIRAFLHPGLQVYWHA